MTAALVQLGLLTRLENRDNVITWGVRSAPVLAYDGAGRLFIVYPGKILRPSSSGELKEYARTHWGARGRGVCRDARLASGPFVTVSPGVSITYTTKKGSAPELVDFVHKWGKAPPTIVQHDCGKPSCAWAGALSLRGGGYKVTERGIVG